MDQSKGIAWRLPRETFLLTAKDGFKRDVALIWL